MSACIACTNESRCDHLGLCQHAARQVMPGPEPVGPALVCECDLELTITELDRGRCACCGGALLITGITTLPPAAA